MRHSLAATGKKTLRLRFDLRHNITAHQTVGRRAKSRWECRADPLARLQTA